MEPQSVTTCQQVFQHSLEGSDVGLLTLNTSVPEIAYKLRLEIKRWEEPGLGKMLGFSLRLTNCEVIHVEACELTPNGGVSVYADSESIKRLGVPRMIEDTLNGLQQTPSAVTWRQVFENLQL